MFKMWQGIFWESLSCYTYAETYWWKTIQVSFLSEAFYFKIGSCFSWTYSFSLVFVFAIVKYKFYNRKLFILYPFNQIFVVLQYVSKAIFIFDFLENFNLVDLPSLFANPHNTNYFLFNKTRFVMPIYLPQRSQIIKTYLLGYQATYKKLLIKSFNVCDIIVFVLESL